MLRPAYVFDKLAGVPLHYDWSAPPFGYGTRGRPAKFYAERSFVANLEQCLQELWHVCPLGQVQVITSAGAWVDRTGFHGRGRAFDLDGIFWGTKSFVTRYDGFEGGDRAFYHAVDAVIRRHFGTVLDYHYNADHHDHFHLDDGTAALNALVMAGDLDNPTIWQDFLLKTAEKGFGVAVPTPAGPMVEKNPLEILHDVYAVIEQTLTDTGLRKQIEGALTAFANHDETQAWLDHYR